MATSDERRFGRDLLLPESADGATRITPTGDLRTVAGRENLKYAHRLRAITLRSSLVHRNEYGGDVPRFIEDLNTPTTRSRLAESLRKNALRDTRITDAAASVAAGTPADQTNDFAATVRMSIQPRGEDTTDDFVVVFEE
jgi:hypothetical protein